MLSRYTDAYLGLAMETLCKSPYRMCGENQLPAMESECKAIKGGTSTRCCMEIPEGDGKQVIKGGLVLAGLELMAHCSGEAEKNTCAEYIS